MTTFSDRVREVVRDTAGAIGAVLDVTPGPVVDMPRGPRVTLRLPDGGRVNVCGVVDRHGDPVDVVRAYVFGPPRVDDNGRKWERLVPDYRCDAVGPDAIADAFRSVLVRNV
jgi:hypothetical protein